MTIVARASINAGAPQQGGLTVAAGDTVDLSLASYVGVGSLLWEIYSYPEGFTEPTGWETATDRYYWAGAANSGLVPPQIDLTAAPWGKFLVRATANYDANERDESLAFQILGPGGIEDVAPLETNQFEATRLRDAALQRFMRATAAVAAPGTSPGDPFVWTGTEWGLLSALAAGVGVSLGARPLRDLATLRGNSINVGTGAETTSLPLDVADTTAALLAGPLCGLLTTTNRVQVTVGFEVLAEETGTAESLRDTFEVLVDVVGNAAAASRTSRLSEGGDSSGAHQTGSYSLALTGPASGWAYNVGIDPEGDTFFLGLAQDAVTGRTARVRTYWTLAEVV